MKKRLGAFILAIIMTLSVGVMAPVYADNETPASKPFALTAEDVEVTSTKGATVTVKAENIPDSGVSSLKFTLLDSTGSLTISNVKATTGTVTAKGSDVYMWTNKTNVTDDGELFTFTVKAADTTLDSETAYTAKFTTSNAWYVNEDGMDTAITTLPDPLTVNVTVDGVRPGVAIATQPTAPSKSLALGATSTLKTVVTNNAGGTLTYQWYIHTPDSADADAPDPAVISQEKQTVWKACETTGNDTDTLTLDTATAGTYYVFCHIESAVTDGATYKANTKAIKYTVSTGKLDGTKVTFKNGDDQGDNKDEVVTNNTVTYNNKSYTVTVDTDAYKTDTGVALVSEDGKTTYFDPEDTATLTGIKAGTYTVTLIGKGNLSGSTTTAKWTIAPATISVDKDDAKLTVTKDATIKTDDAELLKIVNAAVIDAANNNVKVKFNTSSDTDVLALNKAKDTATAKSAGKSTLNVTITADNHASATVDFVVTVNPKGTLDMTLTTSPEATDKALKVDYKTDGYAWKDILTAYEVKLPTGVEDKTFDASKGTWTFTVTTGKKTTTYTEADFKDATVVNRGEYVVNATYEDASYQVSDSVTVTIGSAQTPLEVKAANDWTVYADNFNDQSYSTTIAAIEKAIIAEHADAKSGLALATTTPVTVKDSEADKATVALNAKKTGVTLKLVEGTTKDPDDENKTIGTGASALTAGKKTTVTVSFTSDNYATINYVIEVTVAAKSTAGMTFEGGTLTYTGKALTYEKAKLTDKKLKGKITYTYAAKEGSSLTDGKVVNAGSYTVTAKYDDGTNSNEITVDLTVEPKTLTITSATVKKTWDGTSALAASDISKVKISGVVKGETLKEGEDYTIVAKDPDKAFGDKTDVGSKYKVELVIVLTETKDDEEVALTDKAANYKFDAAKPKTVKASIVAKEVTVTIGVKDTDFDKTGAVKDIEEQIFTGKAIKIADLGVKGTYKVLKSDSTTEYEDKPIALTEGTDYTVKYTNNTKVGTATITINPKTGSNYTFKKNTTQTFKIIKNTLSNDDNTAVASNNYEATVKDVTLVYGTTPKDSVLKGTVKLTSTKATIKGKWTWEKASDIAELDVGTYTNDPKDSSTSVANAKDGSEYIVYNAVFTPTNTSYEKIKVPVKITITQATLTISGVEMNSIDYDASATEITEADNVKSVTFKVGKTEKKLTVTAADSEDPGYYVTEAKYAKTTVGTQKVTVKVALTGKIKQNYKLAKDTYVAKGKIAAQTLTDAAIKFTTTTVGTDGMTYTGKALKPEISVTYSNGTKPLDAKEYTVKYSNNTNVGNATVTVTAKSKSNISFKSTVSATFAITAAELTTLKANDITMTYTGKVPTASQIKGTAKFGSTTVKGTWTFKDAAADLGTTGDAGTYSGVNVTFTPTSKNFKAKDTTLNVTIKPVTVKVKSATLAAKNLGTITDNSKVADVKVTLSNSSLKQGDAKDAKDYTVAANYNSLTAGTQTVTYTVTMTKNGKDGYNYTFGSGSSTYTGTVKGSLTGTLPESDG
jgi:hypothetical protein